MIENAGPPRCIAIGVTQDGVIQILATLHRDTVSSPSLALTAIVVALLRRLVPHMEPEARYLAECTECATGRNITMSAPLPLPTVETHIATPGESAH